MARIPMPIALTFDFDAEAGLIGSFSVQSPSALSKGAYAANEGVPRILALLEKYALPATFFVPGDTADRHPSATRDIAAAGHEIGHHGYMHELPPALSLAEEREMLLRGFDALERQVGERPIGYRSPAWELSDNTFSLLAESGIRYDASQLGADRPYWLYDGDRKTDIVELPSAWELCDTSMFLHQERPHYVTGLAAPSRVEEIWTGEFNGLYQEESDAAYILTMHPEVIGRHHRLQMLERVIKYILSFDAVRFVQMREIEAQFRRDQEGQTAEPIV